MALERIIKHSVAIQAEKDPIDERILSVIGMTLFLPVLILTGLYFIYGTHPPDWFVVFLVLGLILGPIIGWTSTASRPSEIKVTETRLIHIVQKMSGQRSNTTMLERIRKIRINRVLQSYRSVIALEFLDEHDRLLLSVERWKSEVSVFSFAKILSGDLGVPLEKSGIVQNDSGETLYYLPLTSDMLPEQDPSGIVVERVKPEKIVINKKDSELTVSRRTVQSSQAGLFSKKTYLFHINDESVVLVFRERVRWPRYWLLVKVDEKYVNLGMAGTQREMIWLADLLARLLSVQAEVDVYASRWKSTIF